jgi:2-polyprenyl-3-methyl-5-hydroxy-6-metoxy-1,4-benzoquinol methylase
MDIGAHLKIFAPASADVTSASRREGGFDLMSDVQLDYQELERIAGTLYSKMEGAVTATMVHIGSQLGLYKALSQGPATSAELAGRQGLHERWVREWLYNQAAAGLVAVDSAVPGSEVFSLGPEAAVVLADEEHPAFGLGWFSSLPATVGVAPKLVESFRTGVGHPYDVFGSAGAIGIEMSLTPWNRANVVSKVLPALDGVVERLQAGAEVADVGCGTGSVVLAIAAAYPRSRITGYDISRHALERAVERVAEQRLDNVEFRDAREQPLPEDGSLDLVCTFDCMHDMADPRAMASAIRRGLSADGVWLLVEIDGLPTFGENAASNPMASLLYGASVLTCLSSSMSEPGSEGFGTLALHEQAARRLAEEAGFSRFRRLPVDHAANAFYEIRP